jgi:hypothetical protein
MKGKKLDNVRPQKKRCRAITKTGEPCHAAPTAGGLCFFHANPAKARELGSIGGRKNRCAPVEIGDPLPDLNTALAVCEMNQRVIDELYTRKLDPRIGASMIRALTLQLRAIETTDLARRLADVEQKLRESADVGARKAGVVPEQSGENSIDQTTSSTENGGNTPTIPN